MLLLIAASFLAALLGYLAQSTGLCMVRGVNEWKKGNPAFLVAILFSGILAWVAALYAHWAGIPLHFSHYAASAWFALGGFLFGLGTAFNQGCGISTISRLSRGEFKMTATVAGWFAGWCILANWRPNLQTTELPLPTEVTYITLILLTLAAVIWAMTGDLQRRKLWFGMMGIGLLAGFLFLYEPNWTPSALLHDLSYVLVGDGSESWPSLDRYYLLLALLIGMGSAAWRADRFKIIAAGWRPLLLHLCSGIIMGIGAALAKGGNDSQLLLALPTFSSAGVLTVVFMILGIVLGLELLERVRSRD